MTFSPDGPLVYAVILAAAMVEGEITYIAASALVAQGVLNPVAVIAAGAAGAGLGDQVYFYLLRGRLHRWLERWPSVARRAAPLVERVRRHQAAMVLLIRFAPGLRIALAAACAYAEVNAVMFSLLDFLSAIVWATMLLALMAWIGPSYLAAAGIAGWQAALLTGGVILILLRVAGRIERRAMSTPQQP
jgi:membrane protein DedA with SNARE-associated domain